MPMRDSKETKAEQPDRLNGSEPGISGISSSPEGQSVELGGDEKLLHTIEMLAHNDERVQYRALTRLHQMGWDARALDKLLPLLRDGSVRIRISVVRALAALGKRYPEIAGQVIDALVQATVEDPDPGVQMTAAAMLGGLHHDRAVDELIAVVADETISDSGRTMAARALGHVRSERAIDGLLEALKSEQYHLRWAAVVALGNIGQHSSQAAHRVIRELIGALLADPVVQVRSGAALVIGEIGAHQPEITAECVMPLVHALQVDYAWEVRRVAADGLGKLAEVQMINVPGDPRVGALVAALHDARAEVRASAAEALGLIGDARIVKPLIARLNDRVQSVRAAAAAALRRLGTPEALAALEQVDHNADSG